MKLKRFLTDFVQHKDLKDVSTPHVTADMADSILSADSTGRKKMASNFLQTKHLSPEILLRIFTKAGCQLVIDGNYHKIVGTTGANDKLTVASIVDFLNKTAEWKGKESAGVQYCDTRSGFDSMGEIGTNQVRLGITGEATPRHVCECNKDGTATQVFPAGQDWTTERTFKILWASASSCKFYVDGTEVASITTNIPVKALPFTYAIGNGATAPASARDLYFRDLVIS